MQVRLSINSIGRGSLIVVAVAAALAQQSAAPPQSAVTLMPQGRVSDSYEIYSQLLPGHQIEWGDAPRSFWLIEGATRGVPLDSSCAIGGLMNPHQAIRAPQAEQARFAEVLSDFDATCHARYQLDTSLFHLKLPVRVLDQESQNRYMRNVLGYLPPKGSIMQAPPTPDEFKGAAGMHSFTAIYFDSAHSLAMTQIGMYCGGLCGDRRWVVMERKNGRWVTLPWAVMIVIS